MGPAPGPAGGARRLTGGVLDVTVTYLEMGQAPDTPPGPAPFPDLALGRVARPSVEGYRFLYDKVGAPWLWHERRRLSDQALVRLLADPRLEILVLANAGRVAGFAELDRRLPPDCKLAYFGLIPNYIGRGLGRWLLAEAIARAWAGRPRRLLVNTCTFDHPAALPLYRRAGFTVVEEVERRIRDPRASGLLPPDAAPHIPLG